MTEPRLITNLCKTNKKIADQWGLGSYQMGLAINLKRRVFNLLANKMAKNFSKTSVLINTTMIKTGQLSMEALTINHLVFHLA